MAVLFSCQSLTKAYGTRVLFDNLTFGVNDGERLGIIGPNGAGKSTLLKILAGSEAADSGTVVTRRALRLGFVAQDPVFDAEASAETILAEAISGEHLDEHEHAYRIDSVFTRIGLDSALRTRPVGTLSGGWRKRVAIARELVLEPEMLLLDEPTNHLDLEGILWLEKFLAGASFGSILVSHDRYFLEHAANRIFELNKRYPGGFFSSTGGYADFLIKREEFLSGQVQAQRALESKVRREAEWLQRGPPARTTKQRARIDEAGRLMDELAGLRQRNNSGASARIDFDASRRQANKLLVMKQVSKSLGGRPLISDLNLILSPGMKLGLVGRNGSGKTTFLRLLTGELEPDTGTIERAERLRVVYFDQTRELLDKDLTLRRALAPTGDTVRFREQNTHVASWAKRFLFDTEQLEMPVRSLSGGEQARILIARLMLRPADILLLDEPTNDLDIPSLEVLEESLADFPGAVVLITHDRLMLERLSSDLLALDGKGGTEMYTDFTQWRNAQEEARKGELAAKKEEGRKARDGGERKSKPKLSYKEQREWEGMEAAILAGETKVHALQEELERTGSAANGPRLAEVCRELADAQAEVERLFSRWQELETKQK